MAITFNALRSDGLLLSDDMVSTSEVRTLTQVLTLYDGLGVVVGIMIGSGIFASAGTALDEAGSCLSALLAWVVAAVLVAVASQCYCELGASVPSAGGDAEYLRLAYGDRAAFVFVWTNFWVLKPGSQAIIATVFGQYLEAAFSGAAVCSGDDCNGGSSWISTFIAVVCIWALTFNNCMGVRETANLQNGLTALKAAMIVALFTAGLIYLVIDGPSTLVGNFSSDSTDGVAENSANVTNSNMTSDNGSNDNTDNNESSSVRASSWAGFGRAVVPCLWAFDGWADVGSLAEDIVNPGRNLPRIIVGSVAGVAALYLSCNLAYFAVLVESDIVASAAVAVDFSNALGGGAVGRALVAIGVAISTMGSCNGSILTGGRLFYAVARSRDAHKKALQKPVAYSSENNEGSTSGEISAGDGINDNSDCGSKTAADYIGADEGGAQLFPTFFGHLNTYGAPARVLIAQALWATALLLAPGSSFASLLDYFGPASWLFYAFTASATVVLRRSQPERIRPFLMACYPLPPLLVALLAACLVVSSLAASPLYCTCALGFVATGLPVFECLAKRDSSKSIQHHQYPDDQRSPLYASPESTSEQTMPTNLEGSPSTVQDGSQIGGFSANDESNGKETGHNFKTDET